MRTIISLILFLMISLPSNAAVILNSTIVTGDDACVLFKAMKFDSDLDANDKIIPSYKLATRTFSQKTRTISFHGINFQVPADIIGKTDIIDGSYADLECKIISRDEKLLWGICVIPSNWGSEIFDKIDVPGLPSDGPSVTDPVYAPRTTVWTKTVGPLTFVESNIFHKSKTGESEEEFEQHHKLRVDKK